MEQYHCVTLHDQAIIRVIAAFSSNCVIVCDAKPVQYPAPILLTSEPAQTIHAEILLQYMNGSVPQKYHNTSINHLYNHACSHI